MKGVGLFACQTPKHVEDLLGIRRGGGGGGAEIRAGHPPVARNAIQTMPLVCTLLRLIVWQKRLYLAPHAAHTGPARGRCAPRAPRFGIHPRALPATQPPDTCGVYTQHLRAALLVREADPHVDLQPPGPHQRFVQKVRAVCQANDQNIGEFLQPIQFGQQRGQGRVIGLGGQATAGPTESSQW